MCVINTEFVAYIKILPNCYVFPVMRCVLKGVFGILEDLRVIVAYVHVSAVQKEILK